MKKLLVACICASMSLNAVALTKDEIAIRNKAVLAKKGIEVLSPSEVQIVPASKYTELKKVNIDSNDIFFAEQIEKYLAMNAEQKKNGFVEENVPRAKELLDLKNVAPYQMKKYKNELSFESTHIRQSSNDLKLAYTFIGVPSQDVDINIGIAPYGGYKSVANGDDADGWDGAVQFFDKTGVGSCAYTEHNRKLANAGMELIQEFVTYDVNSKPTTILVQGKKQSGYVYDVKWYDAVFSHELECANLDFSIKLRTDVIDLAKRIDSSQ